MFIPRRARRRTKIDPQHPHAPLLRARTPFSARATARPHRRRGRLTPRPEGHLGRPRRLRKGDAPTDPRYESLSPQERRILGLIADGLTNRQIGTEMFLAEKTVKNYVSSLLHKLGFARRTDAAVYAAEMRKNSR
jgi:DNA-binding NarL/FixJ family response regulator